MNVKLSEIVRRTGLSLRYWQRRAERAGVAEVDWHDLRRTCGCRLLQVYGLPMEKVSAWLGHSDVRVTQQRYAFLRVDDLRRAVSGEERRLN